jgi:Domain of unknown function (DUF4398)
MRPGRLASIALLGATALIAACASTPPPTAQMAVATAAVSHALDAGGAELAPAELRSARDKMQRANLAMTAKDYESARTLAEQAQLDAQLGESKAEAIRARKAADATQADGRALREELARKVK